MKILKKALEIYKHEDKVLPSSGVDLIAPLSYATLRDRLSDGGRESLLLAIHYKEVFPEATIAFCESMHSGFPKCEETEYEFKKEILAGTPHARALGGINSVTEAQVIKEAISFVPKRILVICGEAHSTSAYLIWKKIFPKSEILMKCFPFEYEYQKDHPFKVSRSPYVCFFANLARHALLLILGLKLLGKLKHRAD